MATPTQAEVPDKNEAATQLNATGELPSPSHPWSDGVSVQRQTAATANFNRANALLKESLFLRAAESYRAALAQWDHPGIHYNYALALFSLDQPLAVHEHLLAALRYGPGPIEEDKFEHAKSYLALVEQQLAHVDVSCAVPGAAVRLDGKVLFVGPGHYNGFLLAGAHTISASKPGFAPTEKSRELPAGVQSQFDLHLFTSEQLIEYRRPWPLWRPVSLLTGGVALLAAGVVMHVQAKRRFETFDEEMLSRARNDGNCAAGCDPGSDLNGVKSNAKILQTTAAVSYAVGGAALVGGIVYLVLDRAVPRRIDPQERESQVAVLPWVEPRGGGLLGTMRF